MGPEAPFEATRCNACSPRGGFLSTSRTKKDGRKPTAPEGGTLDDMDSNSLPRATVAGSDLVIRSKDGGDGGDQENPVGRADQEDLGRGRHQHVVLGRRATEHDWIRGVMSSVSTGSAASAIGRGRCVGTTRRIAASRRRLAPSGEIVERLAAYPTGPAETST